MVPDARLGFFYRHILPQTCSAGDGALPRRSRRMTTRGNALAAAAALGRHSGAARANGGEAGSRAESQRAGRGGDARVITSKVRGGDASLGTGRGGLLGNDAATEGREGCRRARPKGWRQVERALPLTNPLCASGPSGRPMCRSRPSPARTIVNAGRARDYHSRGAAKVSRGGSLARQAARDHRHGLAAAATGGADVRTGPV